MELLNRSEGTSTSVTGSVGLWNERVYPEYMGHSECIRLINELDV